MSEYYEYETSQPVLKRPPSQLCMAGDDWLSDRDKKQTTRAIAARKKSGITCAAKLEAAAEALRDYLRACNTCNDGSGDGERGYGDGRRILISQIAEYSSYLSAKYEKQN